MTIEHRAARPTPYGFLARQATAATFLVLASAACVSVDAPTPYAIPRPNIVLFLVDDLGWQDTSVPFHDEVTELNRRYHTPNMERLAASGIKFTQAYASAVCSPTRVSLMTGTNAARHRVTNWTLRRGVASDREHPRLDFPEWNVNGWSPDPSVERTFTAPTLPQLLADAGYRTMHVGKAHFGAIDTPGADPRSLGFQHNVAGHAAGAPASYYGEHDYSERGRKSEGEGGPSVWDVPGLEKYHGTGVNLTEALTRESLALIDDAVAADEPFFLYLAHYAVHTPIMADARFVARYEHLDPTEAAYASMVAGYDRSLGDVLDALAGHGIAEDTLVVFLSDNGGLSAVARGGEAHTHNRPLSSGKGSAHEGGVRVPLLMRWPRKHASRSGAISDAPVLVEDLMPTLLEAATVRPPQGIDGMCALDGMGRGAGEGSRALVWHYPNRWGPSGPGIGASSSIRLGDWKLIHYHDPERAEPFELFHLAEDLGETRNLAVERRDKLLELADRLQRELVRHDAQRATIRATGEPVPWPGDAAR